MPQSARTDGTWRVYILLCRNDAFYIGLTNDLERRLKEHSSGRGGHYTRANPPVRLVYSEILTTRSEAAKREYEIKGWTRRKKEALIAGDLRPLKKL